MSTTKSNPYVGPQPFELEDSSFFFGRTIEINELTAYVFAHKVVLLYAQSGAGKTSIINAGLIPKLEQEDFKILPVVRVGVLDNESDTIDTISNIFVHNTIMSLEEREVGITKVSQTTLTEYLGKADEPRLIVFDQFEELFTTFAERWFDRKSFIEQLSEALENDPMLRIVLVIREDYLAQIDPYAPLLPEGLRTRFRLERLQSSEALGAITNPLKDNARSFEDGVAEKLVDDLLKVQIYGFDGKSMEINGKYVEPVQLQLVCFSLWNELPVSVKKITEGHLQKFSDIDKVLGEFYNSTIREVCSKELFKTDELRSFFSNILITALGTRGTIYRGLESTGGIPNNVIDALVEKHLIRAERRSGARWYELTHDRFINPIKESNRKFVAKLEASKIAEEQSIKSQIERKREKEKNVSDAFERYEKVYKLYKELNDIGGQVHTLSIMGTIKLYEECKYAEAIGIYAKIIDLDSQAVFAYTSRADAYWYIEELLNAVNDYGKALSLMEDDPDVNELCRIYHNRGQVFAEMEKYEEAIHDLHRTIYLREEYGLPIDYARNGLAFALGGIGQYELSMEQFEMTLKEHPENAWAYYNRAVIKEKMGDKESALADYKRALWLKNPALNGPKKVYAKTRIQALIQ